jgi:hypothetical protein
MPEKVTHTPPGEGLGLMTIEALVGDDYEATHPLGVLISESSGDDQHPDRTKGLTEVQKLLGSTYFNEHGELVTENLPASNYDLKP